jgi:V8-like Glu-specific endopeptidase
MPENDNLDDEIAFTQIQELRLENVCYQLATRGKWPFKSNFNSTSFFINKNFLLTSAHNVVTTFRKVNFINVAPSRIGKVYHFGNFSMNTNSLKNFRIFPNYDMGNKAKRSLYDIALVYLPDSIIDKNPKFTYENSLPILNDISSLSIGEQIYCAGYPASKKHKNRYRMTLDQSKIIEIKEHSFTHNLNTATGNSGSPIMVKRNNEFHVIGINSIKFNGTLINQIKQNWIGESMVSLDS